MRRRAHFSGLASLPICDGASRPPHPNLSNRPVIDPIGGLPELLSKIEKLYEHQPPSTIYPPEHFA